jgi:hypothetical protein
MKEILGEMRRKKFKFENIRLTCSDAESSRRRTKKVNSIHTSAGWGTPETDFAKTVQL